MEYAEDIYTFALGRIFRMEPRLSRAALSVFGKASALFSLDADALSEALGPFNKYAGTILGTDLDKEAEALEEARKRGYRYLSYDNPCFPPLLSQCEDAPVGLFIRSSDSDANVFGKLCVSVIGTRDITPYGALWCGKIVNALAISKERPTIVSGLAFGVDITAHKAAMEAGLPTIAVLGTGIDTIYPHQHEIYARQIAERECSAVISEYPPDTETLPVNFLSRNRIIAGLSSATILVESRIKGGGMTTARMAASYNRDTFAVPGRNDDIRSQGCNLLIQAHIAEPVIGCESLLKSLDFHPAVKTDARAAKADDKAALKRFYSGTLDPFRIDNAARILAGIRSRPGISLAEIATGTGLPMREVLALSARLESDGFITMDLRQRCRVKL